MDLINELSSELAIAVLMKGRLEGRIGTQDAKSLIAIIETELARISLPEIDEAVERPVEFPLSH